ncbi:MAG: transposase [Proteobacteria bacterium]|nr:transposase [Pseudomonadota bacterium]
MARPLRIEHPGAVCHLTARGNRQEDIFLDDVHRSGFLVIFGKTISPYNTWICHSCCLMGNHYHLLVETLEANLSLGMRQLNGMFTQYSNRRHGKVGHFFQGRFKSILAEKETHLLELCRYIVLNTVRAKLFDQPGKIQWSSYNSTSSGVGVPGILSSLKRGTRHNSQ